MTDLRAAAQQALKAMEKATDVMEVHLDVYFEAMNDLRAALAEPVQEPLTKKELQDLLVKIDPNTQRLPAAFVLFAHAIERAHGIGGEK